MPTITFKVTAAEARELRRQAERKRQTLSAFLRSVALPTAQSARGRPGVRLHPISGLPVTSNRGRKVAQARIDAALADFP